MRYLKILLLWLLLSLQACGQMTITPIMQGFTPSLVLDFTRGTLPVGLTFTRNSIATRVNASGNIETVAADQPRFDYDPVTLQARGILIEEARTNVLANSNDLSNAAWTKSNVTATQNVAGLDGTNSAWTLTATTSSSSGIFIRRAFTSTANTTYTASVYAKPGKTNFCTFQVTDFTANAINARVNLATGAISIGSQGTNATLVSSKVTPSKDGWSKIELTVTIANATTYYIETHPTTGANNTSTIDDSVIYQYFQVEAGSFATSYIPTTTSSVTRAADVLSMPFGSWFNPTEGTWLAETNLVGTVFNNRRILGYSNSPNFLGTGASKAISETYSGSSAISMSGSLIETVRHAMSYSPAGRSVTREGLTPSTGTSTIAPVTGNLFIGQQGTGVSFINGGIRRIVYYPKRLPNTYLQSLTQ